MKIDTFIITWPAIKGYTFLKIFFRPHNLRKWWHTVLREVIIMDNRNFNNSENKNQQNSQNKNNQNGQNKNQQKSQNKKDSNNTENRNNSRGY